MWDGHRPSHISVCRKTSVQTNPPECWRGSSRGRQPASSGIECPEWRSGGKVTAFLQAVGKVLRLFRQPDVGWASPIPHFSLSKNLCSDESARELAGELEGAAARLEWDRMPRKPCCARVPAREARTFAPQRGAKVTALFTIEMLPGRCPKAGRCGCRCRCRCPQTGSRAGRSPSIRMAVPLRRNWLSGATELKKFVWLVL